MHLTNIGSQKHQCHRLNIIRICKRDRSIKINGFIEHCIHIGHIARIYNRININCFCLYTTKKSSCIIRKFHILCHRNRHIARYVICEIKTRRSVFERIPLSNINFPVSADREGLGCLVPMSCHATYRGRKGEVSCWC